MKLDDFVALVESAQEISGETVEVNFLSDGYIELRTGEWEENLTTAEAIKKLEELATPSKPQHPETIQIEVPWE